MIGQTKTSIKNRFLYKKKSSIENNSLWCESGQEELLTANSLVSIHTIIKFCEQKKGRRQVLFMPFLLGHEETEDLYNWADIHYYCVNTDYSPNLDSIKEMAKKSRPDIVILVHYLGCIYDSNNIKVICKNMGAVLIEDATHVLYYCDPYKARGNFVLFSPWKTIGLPDGAVLIINDDTFELGKSEIKDELLKILSGYPRFSCISVLLWKIRSFFKKALPDKHSKVQSKEICNISVYSKHIISASKKSDIELLGETKKVNYDVIKECLRRYEVGFGMDWNNDSIPYGLSLKIKSVEEGERLRKVLLRAGIASIIQTRKDILSEEQIETPKMDECRLLIPIHNKLNPNKYVKKLCRNKKNGSESRARIERISKEEYEEILGKTDIVIPILQSFPYAEAKVHTGSWRTFFYSVKIDNSIVAVFIALRKLFFIHRINQGPLILDDSCEDEVFMAIYKFFKYRGPLFFAAGVAHSGNTIITLIKSGFYYLGYDFVTGFLDLRKSVEDLLSCMTVKWRNQLKKATKSEIVIKQISNFEEFKRLLALHSLDKKNRHYTDSGDEITEYLFNEGSLSVYAAYIDETVVSYIFVAEYMNTSTYYIGWSSSEGHNLNANRLLLWHAILKCKEKGLKWFDLGGIDRINTKGIADYKLGLGCDVHKYAGEFVKL